MRRKSRIVRLRSVEGIHSGTDDVLEAFKGEMRYRRVMELDYADHSDVQAKPESIDRDRRYLDEGKSWTGTVLLERNAVAGSSRVNTGGVYRPRFDYRSTNKVTTRNHFPPSVYFFNTGLALADPTCGNEADRNLTQVANIEALLSQVRFEIVTQESVTEEVPLVELKANYTIQLRLNGQVESQQLSDRIWLDKSHALAVAKRELRIGEWLASIVNEDFAEVASGFWLPRQSELSIWADAEKVDQQEPLVRSRTNLLQWIVNEVPDDLFTIALTPPQRYSLFDQAPAFHWTSGNAGFRVEGWAAKDTGVRVEHRDDAGQLVMLVIETPEQKITWRPSRNRVTVQLSHLKESNGYAYVSVNVAAREAIVRDTEMLTGMLQSRKELLGDRGEVERLFAYYPADPKLNFEGNLHHADPLILRNAPLPTVFFTRRHWFDLQTGLIVARQCGCKAGPAIDSTYVPETNIDYPAPESSVAGTVHIHNSSGRQSHNANSKRNKVQTG